MLRWLTTMLGRGGQAKVQALPQVAPAPAPIPEPERRQRAAAERRMPVKWRDFDQLVAGYSAADGVLRRSSR